MLTLVCCHVENDKLLKLSTWFLRNKDLLYNFSFSQNLDGEFICFLDHFYRSSTEFVACVTAIINSFRKLDSIIEPIIIVEQKRQQHAILQWSCFGKLFKFTNETVCLLCWLKKFWSNHETVPKKLQFVYVDFLDLHFTCILNWKRLSAWSVDSLDSKIIRTDRWSNQWDNQSPKPRLAGQSSW